MSPIRPYRISVYNRITGDRFAEFYSNQVPQRGDQVTVYPSRRDESDPFHNWGHWIVDAVVWIVAHPASDTAFRIARETGGDMSAAYAEWVELHVWPAEGPHWTKTPKFAKVLRLEDEDEATDD